MKTAGYTNALTGATVTSATLTFDRQGLITSASTGNGSDRYTATATAAGTTTLTNTSTETQYFTGSTTQTVTLPVVTTLANGWTYRIVNMSTGSVTVQSSGANSITVLPTNGGWGVFTCIDTTAGSGTASWAWLSGIAQLPGLTRMAVGSGANASSTGSMAFGANASSSGISNIAFGVNSVASGASGAIAFGSGGATASAASATAIGVSAVANAASSAAIGAAATTNSVTNGTSIGAASTLVDSAHGLGFAVPSASVAPGSIGVTVNGAAYAIRLYSSDFASTATAAGTTTLTATSAQQQYFTGSTTQTVTLPVVTTLANGFHFKIANLSSGAVTVQSSGGNTVATLAGATAPASKWGLFTCINTAGGTGTQSWSYDQGT